MRVLRRVSVWLAGMLLLSVAGVARAQGPDVRGVLRDSASGEPIPGAVVMVLDARGQVLNRTVSGARGQYRVLRPASAVQLRALRLGFRPATLALPTSVAPTTVLDVSLATVARVLEGIDVVAAQGCPVRRDRAEAFGLLDQARAGLLATVVVRERLPATMRVLRYERWLDLDGIAIERQVVQLDSSANATTSFNAVQSANDFVSRGFREGRDGRFTYFSPDADVLLDERFQRGYCFSLAEVTAERAGQLGLRFTPATRRRGRVDIEGTLWVDTAQRVLRDIEFLYVGVDNLAASFASGGRINFHALPSGISFIDRWSLRLVGAPDTIETDLRVSTQEYAIREIGGEVASARWPDSTTFVSTLATAHFTAVRTNGRPAASTRLSLFGTDYRAITDSLGRASIPFVLPGPYRVVANDARLDLIDVDIPTPRVLQVQRASSALTSVIVPTAEEHVGAMCGTDTLMGANAWLLARVVGPDGAPLGDVPFRISDRQDGQWRTVSDRGRTPSTGLIAMCRILAKGADVEVSAWRRDNEVVRVRGRLDEKLNVLRVVVPERTIAARAAADTAPILITGVVMDTAKQEPVADARVTFLGTPFEGATDETGRFVIGGVPRGRYRVEVSSPWHDSIGTVSRNTVTVRDTTPLTLYMPVIEDVIRATCGSAERGGIVVGRVAMRNGSTIPAGLRVVAEWSPPPADSAAAPATAATNVVVDGVVETSGTFRVCGVPTDAPILVRAEATGIIAGGARQAVSITDERRFARADLELDSSAIAGAVFVGVVTDSASVPIANAEITLTDIGQTTRTDGRGAFRFDNIPDGIRLVAIRQVGYAPSIATMEFTAGRVTEQRVALSRATALRAIEVNADGAPIGFDERRRLGNGVFLGRADLEKHRGRRLGEVASQVRAFGQAAGGGSHSYLVGKRAPVRLPPRSSSAGGGACGQFGPGGRQTDASGQPLPSCTFTLEGLREQGYYCPTQAEQRNGILSCACFARVYIDDLLMNSGRPTEPFDISTIAVDEVAAVEFYASAVVTPARYQALQGNCGVLLVWTRR